MRISDVRSRGDKSAIARRASSQRSTISGVNEAGGAIQERKLISYSRGKIRILNRKGLEAAACQCYAKIEGLNESA